MRNSRDAVKKVTLALAASAFFFGPLRAEPVPDEPHWQPDDATVAALEASIRQQMQEAHLNLDRYGRNYWGVTLAGRRVIYGNVIYVEPNNRGGLVRGVVTGTEPDHRFYMSDGFCSNISVKYDVDARRFDRLACDGFGALTAPRLAPR